MFDEFRERRNLRNLRREISVLEKKTAGWDWRAAEWFGKDSEQAKEQEKLQDKLYPLKQRLDAIETERLTKKARQLGIEIPSNRTWWWDDLDYVSSPDEATFYLTDIGKAGVSKLIREERRKNIEWWVKTITPILGALISLLGLVIALISVSKK
jgi:lipopolysaccharide export LptBFGC system permease protein LptF